MNTRLVVIGVIGLAALCVGSTACSDTASSCSVQESDAGVQISCEDGTRSVIPRGGSTVLPDGAIAQLGCTVAREGSGATITCSDGSRVMLPFASGIDGGTAASCDATPAAAGAILIQCPDGTKVTLPGPAGDLSSLKLVGATAASCGTCHDDSRSRAHFAVMTAEDNLGPVETCGTCHNETSIEPVSKAHARLELLAPGLQVKLSNAVIDPVTRKPTVRVQLSDNASAAVAREGLSLSFVISKVETIASAATGAPIAGPYRSYISRVATQKVAPGLPFDGGAPLVVQQPASEASTAGVFTLVSPGVYDYTFAFALPADFDTAATHVIAVYATRTLSNVRYVGNAELFFVPSNPAATPLQRNVVHTETCNGCHNPLGAHGGSRQDVQLCLTCHTQGAVDPETGNTIDFNVMVHKIHMGSRLPNHPYQIIGNAQSVNDWSQVNFPQPVENCQSCHGATDGDRWVTNGTRAACVSCHEKVDLPAAQGGHPFALQPNSSCGNTVCHAPGGNGRDAIASHPTTLNVGTTPLFNIELVSVTLDSADSKPLVRVRASSGTRASGTTVKLTNVNGLSMLDVLINGPNVGFALNGNTLIRIPKAQLLDLAAADVPGEFTFSLPKTLRELVGTLGDPDNDSYTLSLRAQYDPTPGVPPDTDLVDQQKNPSMAFGAGEQLTKRAGVVLTEKCNKCHGDLTAHGGANLAKNVEQCTMCHTGSLDTRVRQGANKQAGPTTSLRLSTLIHRIHGSAIAKTPYKVFGFSATGAPYPVLDFSDRGFPGNLRDCATCHDTGSYFLPLPVLDPPTRTVSLDADGGVIGP